MFRGPPRSGQDSAKETETETEAVKRPRRGSHRARVASADHGAAAAAETAASSTERSSWIGRGPVNMLLLRRRIEVCLQWNSVDDPAVQWVSNEHVQRHLLALLPDEPIAAEGDPLTLIPKLKAEALAAKIDSKILGDCVRNLITEARLSKYGAAEVVLTETISRRGVTFQELSSTPGIRYGYLVDLRKHAGAMGEPSLAMMAYQKAQAMAKGGELHSDPEGSTRLRDMLIRAVADPDMGPVAICDLHEQYQGMLKLEPLGDSSAVEPRKPGRPRIALLTGRALRTRFISSWLELLQKHAEVTVIKYEELPFGDSAEARLADKIRCHHFDMVIEFEGYTGSGLNLLPSLDLAPVQINFLGYPSTTGLASKPGRRTMRIVDAITDPPGKAEGYNREELLHIDGGFHCYRPEYEINPKPEPPCVRNPGSATTFGYFGNPSKLHRATLVTWKKILDRVPGSALHLRYPPNPDTKLQQWGLVRLIQEVGFGAGQVAILPAADGNFYPGIDGVDIMLDSYPYNGTTSSIDHFLCGVPMVTLNWDDRHATRVGKSLLHQVGLPDLATDTEEAYIETAVALAKDHPRLSELKKTLPARARDAFCNGPAFFARFWAQIEPLLPASE